MMMISWSKQTNKQTNLKQKGAELSREGGDGAGGWSSSFLSTCAASSKQRAPRAFASFRTLLLLHISFVRKTVLGCPWAGSCPAPPCALTELSLGCGSGSTMASGAAAMGCMPNSNPMSWNHLSWKSGLNLDQSLDQVRISLMIHTHVHALRTLAPDSWNPEQSFVF